MTTDAQLTERFAPVFARIADGSIDREVERRLPSDEVEWLRDAGFGKIRVPVEYGGLGATVPQFIRQLIELGRADSNLPQLLRGHFGFVESRLSLPDAAVRERWLHIIAGGALVGNAQSETGNGSFLESSTTVTKADDGWRLAGKKFYSTGSLFADWIHTSAKVDSVQTANVLVSTSASGVQRIDDWDGFGQRLTGSGTTIFENVLIPDQDVEPYPTGHFAGTYLLAFFQLIHLATLAGIGKAAVDDIARFVNQRGRNLMNPAYPQPQQDPQIQQVVGKVAGASFAATATTLAVSGAVGAIADAVAGQQATPELFDAADLAAFSAQTAVIELVLGLTSDVFEVGGASAVTERFRLDRHWRNARTLASHNPAIYRQTIVGDHVLNGTSPTSSMTKAWEAVHNGAAHVTAGAAGTADE